MLLPIAKLPARVLRTPTQDVAFPLSKDIRRLLKDMLVTVKKAQGIGLAAPQVGRSLNLALIFLEEAGIPPFPIFNPKIVNRSKENAVMEEGCLSLPGVFGVVTRPKKITIEAQDSEGKKINLTDDGLLARVLMHEIDHLNNVLIVDKLEKITHGHELLEQYKE